MNEKIKQIEALIRTGLTQKKIAEALGCSQQYVSRHVLRAGWKNFGHARSVSFVSRFEKSCFSWERYDALIRKGLRKREIADIFGMNHDCLYQRVHRRKK